MLIQIELTFHVMRRKMTDVSRHVSPGTQTVGPGPRILVSSWHHEEVVLGFHQTLPDVGSRVNAAWPKWCESTGIQCGKRMPEHLNAKINKRVIQPVAL